MLIEETKKFAGLVNSLSEKLPSSPAKIKEDKIKELNDKKNKALSEHKIIKK